MSIIGFLIESEVEYDGCGIMNSELPWMHLPRVFDLWVLALCTKGTMFLNIDGTEYTIRPGDVFILPVRKLHYGPRLSEGGISYYWVHFQAPGLEKVLHRDSGDAKNLSTGQSYLMHHVSLLDVNTVSMLFNQLYANNYVQHYTPYLQKSLLKVLLYEISNQTLLRHAHKFDQRFVQLLDYFRSNFTSEIPIDELAEQFGYNKYYLCRLFKQRVGRTINTYQTELRMCYACQLLRETNHPIKRISSEVGYESEKYFMRIFKDHMRMTPSEYRNSHKIAIFEGLPRKENKSQ